MSSASHAGKHLVGRKVEISVGEPWDFSSADGENVLKGRIIDVRFDSNKPASQEVLIEVTPFKAKEGVSVEWLVATRRYRDSTTMVAHLAAGEAAEVNFGYGEQIPEGKEDPKGSPFLIGGFWLIAEDPD